MVDISEEARLRSTVEMLVTALEVAIKHRGPMSPVETQLIRSALLIARENLGEKTYASG